MQFQRIFIIPKSQDWGTANAGIRDWWKRPGSRDPV